MGSRIGRTVIALGLGIAFYIFLLLIAGGVTPGTTAERLLIMLGGTFPEGIIQGATYFIFFFAMLELGAINKGVSREEEVYSWGILPEKEQFVLSPPDVNQVKLTAIEKERGGHYLLTDVVKKACTKYRAEKSSADALGIVTSQCKINLAKAESEQGIIRYSAWAIPSVGFIGTVIGIAQSLGYANEAGTDEGLKKVTDAMNVAFDTTLVALVLSTILMLYFHVVQARVERLHSDMEEYVIENLINRMYKA